MSASAPQAPNGAGYVAFGPPPVIQTPKLARNQVERFFNRIEQCRQIATRYDRLAANYLAFNRAMAAP
jgi:hypothetical protein